MLSTYLHPCHYPYFEDKHVKSLKLYRITTIGTRPEVSESDSNLTKQVKILPVLVKNTQSQQQGVIEKYFKAFLIILFCHEKFPWQVEYKFSTG